MRACVRACIFVFVCVCVCVRTFVCAEATRVIDVLDSRRIASVCERYCMRINIDASGEYN